MTIKMPFIACISTPLLCFAALCQNSYAEDYKPELFSSMTLVYEEQFKTDGPHTNAEQWEIRQNTQWEVKDGVLIGSSATEEYQKQMQAKNDAHDGTRPVIFIKPVPKALVIMMRVRYDGKYENGGKAQLDFGHHINSFIFNEKQTDLTIQKKDKVAIKDILVPLNTWVDVVVEVKEGALLFKVNDKKQIVKNAAITLQNTEVQQIDFKGIKLGNVKIDWVKLYAGVE